MTKEQVGKILAAHAVTDKVIWIGYRSANSKYGEYDDIAGLYTPGSYTEYKFNTLPTKWEGTIAKLMPGVYKYKKGLHGVHHLNLSQRKDGSYICPADKGIHDWLMANPGKDHAPVMVGDVPRLLPYWAFRQAGPVTILRHGAVTAETVTDPANWPFIDLHKGGWNLTSSEGCQTWFPEHWEDARAHGYAEMDKYGQDEIKYVMVQL